MHARRVRTVFTAVLVFGVGFPLLLTTACGETSSKVAYQKRLADTGEPALHAVHNARLQELMARIDRLTTQGDYARSLELEQSADEAIEVGESLVKDAATMYEFKEQLELSCEEQLVYEKMATKLRMQAESYLDSAKRKDFDGMEHTLETMVRTCDACHSTFRRM